MGAFGAHYYARPLHRADRHHREIGLQRGIVVGQEHPNAMECGSVSGGHPLCRGAAQSPLNGLPSWTRYQASGLVARIEQRKDILYLRRLEVLEPNLLTILLILEFAARRDQIG